MFSETRISIAMGKRSGC